MMIDLLATDNTVSYNVKIANVMGLHTAIYITELLNISAKATAKKKLVNDKYFVIDRKYILKRTTLELQEQLAIDSKLSKVNVIQKPENAVDTIYVDVEKLSEILSSDDSQYLQKITTSTKVKTTVLPGMKQTMKQKQAAEMKTYITTLNPEIKSALEGWVDGVYANPNGFLSKRAVTIFERAVDTFANGDFNIAMKIIDIATTNGYRDAQWAINSYQDNVRKSGAVKVNTGTRRVVLSDEVY